MVQAQPKPFLTPEEYLAIERESETRSEYLDGEMFAMSGGSYLHNVIVGKPITKVEAEKKYPPSKGGGYPTGERDPHDPSGTVASPYPPHQKFDCAKISHGALVLDTTANKVFVRP